MDWEAVWNRARNDFVHTKSKGDLGLLLWEHSVRVARSACRILSVDEVHAAHPDQAAVLSAAVFHHSGWIMRTRRGEFMTDAQMLSPLTESDRELGASLLMTSLKGAMPEKTLSRAAKAIVDAGDRHTDSMEAIVVAEADALDEFGLPAFCMALRRGAVDGKAAQASLETWQRQIEYRFWEARLQDAFRMPAVRAIARSRLDRFALTMRHFAEEQAGLDVELELRDAGTDDETAVSQIAYSAIAALK